MSNTQTKKILSNIVKQHNLKGQFLHDGLAFQISPGENVDILVQLGVLSLIQSVVYRVGDNILLLAKYL